LQPGAHARPVVLVQYSSGALAAYDSRSRVLAGRAQKRERVDFQDSFSSFLCWALLPTFEDPIKKDAARVAAVEAAARAVLEAEAAQLAAEAAAAKAAAGGKGGKAAAPVEEAPAPEEVEENQAESEPAQEPPYVYVPQPPEPQENEVDLVSSQQLRQAMGTAGDRLSSGASDGWQGLCCLADLSSELLLCSAQRGGSPVLVVYALDDFLAAAASVPGTAATAVAARGSQAGPLTAAATAPLTGAPRHLQSHVDVQMTVPAEKLRLTEARLQALESTFPSHSHSHFPSPHPFTAGSGPGTSYMPSSTVLPGQRGPGQGAGLGLDPRALSLAGAARSKAERAARTKKLAAATSALASILKPVR
jgi:hypothetical protein